jgi:hypothetical protein
VPNQVAMATNPQRLIPQSHMWECGISHLSEICTTTSWPWPLIRLEMRILAAPASSCMEINQDIASRARGPLIQIAARQPLGAEDLMMPPF